MICEFTSVRSRTKNNRLHVLITFMIKYSFCRVTYLNRQKMQSCLFSPVTLKVAMTIMELHNKYITRWKNIVYFL